MCRGFPPAQNRRAEPSFLARSSPYKSQPPGAAKNQAAAGGCHLTIHRLRPRSLPSACVFSFQEFAMPQDSQTINRVRSVARAQVREISGFDYAAPAELYPSRNRRMRGPVAYKRFDNAAEALRYAMEQMPESALLGATLEVNEQRFGGAEIRSLYQSAAFPLKRRAKAS
jgi:hypothetical protein